MAHEPTEPKASFEEFINIRNLADEAYDAVNDFLDAVRSGQEGRSRGENVALLGTAMVIGEVLGKLEPEVDETKTGAIENNGHTGTSKYIGVLTVGRPEHNGHAAEFDSSLLTPTSPLDHEAVQPTDRPEEPPIPSDSATESVAAPEASMTQAPERETTVEPEVEDSGNTGTDDITPVEQRPSSEEPDLENTVSPAETSSPPEGRKIISLEPEELARIKELHAAPEGQAPTKIEIVEDRVFRVNGTLLPVMRLSADGSPSVSMLSINLLIERAKEKLPPLSLEEISPMLQTEKSDHAIYQAMSKLTRQGLVEKHREGKKVTYAFPSYAELEEQRTNRDSAASKVVYSEKGSSLPAEGEADATQAVNGSAVETTKAAAETPEVAVEPLTDEALTAAFTDCIINGTGIPENFKAGLLMSRPSHYAQLINGVLQDAKNNPRYDKMAAREVVKKLGKIVGSLNDLVGRLDKQESSV